MTTPVRRRLRLLRRGAWYALASVLLLLALGNGVGSQLLPLAERHPDRIADWLSRRAQSTVRFDDIDTEWTRRGPLLRLENLRVGEGRDAVRIGNAEVLVAQYAGFLPGRSLTELRVRGLDLTLRRDAAGRWQVLGLPGQEQDRPGDPLATLERLGELQVSHARLRVVAPELGLDLRVPRVDLRMRVDGPRVRAGALAWLRPGGTPFRAAIDFERSSGDGVVYAGSRAADLRDVAGEVAVAAVSPVSGQGRVDAWARLAGHRVVGLHADAELAGVVLDGAPTVAGGKRPRLALGTLEMDARWAGSVRQWRVDATRLRIGQGDAQQSLDGLALAGGEHYGLRAKRIDAGPLLALAALGDPLPAALRRWLLASRAGATLEDVAVAGTRGGGVRAQARLRDLQFAPVGTTPGMRGVGAELLGDEQGLKLALDPAARAVFDWPAGFGVAHAVALEGDVLAWRDGPAWHVQTPGLALTGEQLDVRARGGMAFPGDGTRPRLDLAADIGEAPVTLARGFWVHHLMPKATVNWLDSALRDGRLKDVHAVVAGDLDDWPFRSEEGKAGAGKFRVDARIAGGVIKFQPEWPAMEAVDGDIRFEADGFTIDGRGRISGVQVSTFSAGIPRFGRAELRVDAEAAGDAADFLALLQASPLRKDHGEVMDNLQVAGPARADLHLMLPLHHQQAPAQRLQGSIDLAGVQLREKRWNLAFDKVRGAARYDGGGFVADGLQVQNDGEPGRLSLRAGPHVRDPRQAFEAELQASIGIDDLLDKAGNLAWLKPHVSGRSGWSALLAVPRGASAPTATRLQLRSNLVGTSIDLPTPVTKPSGQAMPTRVSLSLPLERGEVSVALGDLLNLRSRSDAQQTGIRVQLGGEAAEAPPARGLEVSGRAPRVDALSWIGVMTGDAGAGASLPLRKIDVTAGKLRLLGADFDDARLLLVPAPGGTAVQVQGPGIAGSLLVPEQESARVAGRFERLYWRKLPKGAAGAAGASAAGPVASAAGGRASPAAAAGDETFDPAKIPPLLFEVGDLRLGDAVLGSARFRSTPTVSGLRMDEFTTRSPRQRLGASGTWTGRGEAGRTRIALDVDSDDIGALLDGLGLGGQVDGGKGRLALSGGWKGGPEAFDAATMDATASIDARDGRLLELEPGAGRVLGLLGIAQLPRRLTLDFRDFFEKGFAFDRIRGEIRLDQGVARTDKLSIEGPAADIHVHGSADLRTQRFDQTVEVLPKSGGLLTAVGAIAGGPVGAAVGAVANAVLDKPLQGLGAKTYRVTGPWASPQVEVTARGSSGAARPPPASAPPPPGDSRG